MLVEGGIRVNSFFISKLNYLPIQKHKYNFAKVNNVNQTLKLIFGTLLADIVYGYVNNL